MMKKPCMIIFSALNGSVWCYIQSGIGDKRYEHCPDVKNSLIFPGEKWSFHACTTPSITSEECKFALDQYGKKTLQCHEFLQNIKLFIEKFYSVTKFNF